MCRKRIDSSAAHSSYHTAVDFRLVICSFLILLVLTVRVWLKEYFVHASTLVVLFIAARRAVLETVEDQLNIEEDYWDMSKPFGSRLMHPEFIRVYEHLSCPIRLSLVRL
jgi:hypothetical protein